MTKQNVTWKITWFQEETERYETVTCSNIIDNDHWDEFKEFAIFWCFDRLEAFRSQLHMPEGVPLFRTFVVLNVSTPSDLAW